MLLPGETPGYTRLGALSSFRLALEADWGVMAKATRRRGHDQLDLRDDLPRLRKVFTLVPWRMRTRIILLLVVALVAALLDIVAVVAILPLTQMLTSPGQIPPIAQEFVVPLINTSDRQAVLLTLALFIGLGFLVKNLALIGIRWWSIGETTRASAAVQSEMLRRYLSASYASHRTRSKSVILQTITGAVNSTFTAVLLGYIALIVDGLTIVLLFVTLIFMSPVGSLIAIAVYGGAALLMARVLKPWALRYAVRALDLGTESWRYLNPAIEGFRESRIFQRESLFVDSFAANRRQLAHVSRIQLMLGEMPKYLMEIVMIFGIIAVAVFLFATSPESTAFGILAVFAAAAMRIAPALNRMVATVNGIRGGSAPLKLVNEQIDELAAERSSAPDATVIEIPDADIVADQVGFTYPGAREPVLKDISTVISRGATVALVGSSGAGKTTFADLIVGLLQPTTGSISVGGVNISTASRLWMSRIAMVSQKVYLWDATVRDLITFGEPRASVDDALLADVVRRAQLEDMVASLPRGLDTMVGDSGSRVSGGQAQRIGIARALYHQPSILVLDEATSALDNETEHQITSTIEALHGKLTVIVIAHRLSTVKNADEILFFSRGRLKASGTMRELTKRDREFARLVELGSLT